MYIKQHYSEQAAKDLRLMPSLINVIIVLHLEDYCHGTVPKLAGAYKITLSYILISCFVLCLITLYIVYHLVFVALR